MILPQVNQNQTAAPAQPTSAPGIAATTTAETSKATSASCSSASVRAQPPMNTQSGQRVTVTARGKRQRQSDTEAFVSRPMIPLQQIKVDKALVKMIATDFQPFSIVGDKGFREYTKVLDPSYVLPSRHTVSRQLLPNLFEQVRTELLEKIKTALAVCLTTDCWTSSNTTTGYVSVTCHYVNDFKLQSNLPDCFEITDNHTAANLARELRRIAT